MTILSSRDGAAFCTKALPWKQAQRFAQCLAANPQYADVEIRPNLRRAGTYRVHYRPTDPARVERLRRAFQGSREERAAAQAHCYAIRPCGGGAYEVANLVSGVVYTVNAEGCDCPDHQYRCAGNAVRCKHQILVQNFQQAEREAQHLSSLAEPATILPPADARLERSLTIARTYLHEDFPAD